MCINLAIIHTQYVYFISFVLRPNGYVWSYWWWSSIRRRARKVKAFDHLRPTTIYVNAAERKQRNAKGTLRKVQSDHGLEIAVVHTRYTFPFMYLFRPNIPFSICILFFICLIYWKHLNTVFFRTPILYNLKFTLIFLFFSAVYFFDVTMNVKLRNNMIYVDCESPYHWLK